MNFLSTTSHVPLAPASPVPALAGLLPAIAAPVAASSLHKASVQHLHKSREFATHSAHRAQVLAQRRTTVPSSAKRW